MKNPYLVLGVSKSATQEEIKNAYRSLAKKHHPDLNPGNKEAETKFKDLSAAYELVGNAEERAKFDRGETPEQQEQAKRGPFYHETQQDGGRYSQSFGKGMGGSDFFENLFRSAGRATEDYPGEDQVFQMSVNFKDSVLGAEREVTFPNGKRLHVKIPPGVETGTKLRFKHQGGKGAGKAPAGDAYVEILVTPLPGFKRVENNIETELPVSFIEALLGAEVQVPTLDGSVVLKIPAGVSSGSRLRVRGKGVPVGVERGDQIVILKVEMPKKIDPSLQEAVREWGGKHSYNPRSEP